MNWLLCLVINIIAVTVVSCALPYQEDEMTKYMERNYWQLRKKYKKIAKQIENNELKNERVYDYRKNAYILHSVIVLNEGYLNITLDGVNFFSSPGALECIKTDKFKVLMLVTSSLKGEIGKVITIQKHSSEDYYVHPPINQMMKLKKTYNEQDFETMKNWYKTKQITKDLEERIPVASEDLSIIMGPFLLDLKRLGEVTIPGVLLVETRDLDYYFIVEAVEENDTWIQIMDGYNMKMGKAIFKIKKYE